MNIPLLVNAILFCASLLFYLFRKKRFDVGTIFYTIMAISAIGSVWFYSYDHVDTYWPNVRITPLLFLWFTINICIHPCLKTDFSKVRQIDDTGISSILDGLTSLFIVLSIFPLLSLLSHFSFDLFVGNTLGQMYESETDKASLFFSGPSKFCFALIRRFESLVLILSFYQLTKKNKRIELIIGTMIPITLFVLFKMLAGSRGGVMGTFITILCLAVYLRNCFSSKVWNKIRLVGITVTGLMFVGIAYISLSRFAYSVSAQSSTITIDQWISQYLGESFIRFSDKAWDTPCYMNGDQNFIYIKKILGFNVIEDYDRFMPFYEAKLHMPVNVFYTFMGDFYLDFGVIGGIMFAIIFAFIFNKLLSNTNRKVTVVQLLFLTVFFHILGFGFAANVYRTIFIQKDLMYTFILAGLLWIVQKAVTPPIKPVEAIDFQDITLIQCKLQPIKVYAV